MNKWECPFAYRTTHFEYLLCKQLMVTERSYIEPRDCVTAMCAHQRHCNCTHRVENTEKAKECFRYQSGNTLV